MTTMTAIVTNPDHSLTASQIERPTPGPSQILIKNAAAGINPIDWKIRANGDIFGTFDPDAPMVLGWDVAGEVVEVGAGVTRFAVGDRVFGMPRFPRPANAYAEYVVAGAREVAKTPENVTDIEAGALPLAVLTAWQSVVDTLHVAQGDRVLIHAASGGVGHLAVQIAKARGAEIWATASAGNHALLRDLGVDHPIDYKAEQFEEIATNMDAVFDLVGSGENATRSVKCLKRGGEIVTVGEMPSQEAVDDAGVTAMKILVEPDYAALEQVAEMLKTGTLRVVIADTRPLAQIDELHTIGQAGGPMGKLVATIN